MNIKHLYRRKNSNRNLKKKDKYVSKQVNEEIEKKHEHLNMNTI